MIKESGDAFKMILLDTTQESSLDWTRLPYGPQARTPGWVEESFTNFEQGINWRSYVVCDVAYNNVNNWLWTPFIERHNANRIYIEIKFSMRDCNLFPGMALSCKETFSLLYYEHDGLNKEPPPWEPESYKLIDRIAADEGRFTSNSEVIINTEIRSVPVTKKGVYFAFRDQGACLSIIAIKIFYITCPNITTNFAFYPETPTGRELTTIVETDGVCVANSQQVEIPRLLCKGDGNWTLPSGGCKCMPGYEPMGQSCQVCSPGKFKPIVGDELCQPCPAHSKSSYHGSTECRCDAGYYRAPKDPKWIPCTQPPSSPQNLTINFLDQSTVILTWNKPKFLGGRNDTVYRISCDYCPSSTNYVPSQETINDTRVVISGLNPMTSYRFQVYAENGVSGYDSSQFVEITATTEASALPATTIYPPILRITSADGTQISLAWKRNPNDNSNNDPANEITAYELRYHSNDIERNSSSILISKDQFETTITGLKPQTEYTFQIRSRTKTGWSEFSKPMMKMTGQRLANPAYISGDNESVQTRIIIVGVILLIVIVTFIISLVLFYLKKNNEDCNKKQPSDCDTLEYRSCGMEGKKLVSTFDHAPIVPTPRFNSTFSVATPLFTNCATSRSYVDPHTYEDPNQAVKEFTKEIDASHITIEAIIGGGEFGDVCRGKLKIPGKSEVTVAIKTLKPTTAEKPRLDFLTEASIMGQFDHSNVIYLQGVVTKTNPIMIITEYMEHGSLDAFLRANEGKFTILQLIGMLRGIASGMEYLSTMNYVHRDLAARNVLVNSSLVCKIADFGLSREIESATEGAYTTRGGKIPVRWTAPEAIAFRKFTSASDVWSFGIVCWEVMSYGERPYWNWSNQDVIKSIEKGYRLPPPIDCPDAVYQLMLESWQKDRSNRPTFTQIVKTLDKLAKCPENLMKLAQQMTRVDPFIEQTSIPDVIQFKSFYEWLASIKMSRYQINFEHAGINNLPAVARLSPQDLLTIGIDIPSHQKKIMNSIFSLRAQNSIGSPEGFLV
ncbi:Ephrin type-A receptor 5 [Dermatophagoides farinae]|uniref:receptor protein-tyrosine kinase n=1 Tax=Dermatophagoides farinae TaxID=6954 RepID=A0A922IFR9_DERFA|nr:Ephrin type-A receptor 5 [Dermatophagoides farinae]